MMSARRNSASTLARARPSMWAGSEAAAIEDAETPSSGFQSSPAFAPVAFRLSRRAIAAWRAGRLLVVVHTGSVLGAGDDGRIRPVVLDGWGGGYRIEVVQLVWWSSATV
jgi:hypothetical protein